MKKLFKCSVCGFVFEGETAPSVCPKCGVGPEKFEELDKETSDKIYRADKTNDIHATVIALATEIIELSEAGIRDNLDPGCLNTFEKAKNEAWIIKQRSKAEIEKHIKGSKW
ncbi:MAG: rubredoxin-like domain-containing protein [Clostridium sp.]|uniref:rubredoxin-like domain-containing protein n=1 Tax=Clostridium sp. TaxID=1506 RepID=UPI003F34937C